MNIALPALRLPAAPGVRFASGLLAALLALAFPASARLSAQWTAGSGTWSDAANWLGSAVPGAPGDLAIFNAATNPGDKAVTLTGSATLGSLLINGVQGNETATALAFDGGLLVFDSGGLSPAIWRVEHHHDVTVSSSVALVTDLNIALSNPDDGHPSTLTLGGPLDAAGRALAIDVGFQSSVATLNGALAGDGSTLVKTGLGILRLNHADNTFSGGLVLNAGRTETAIRSADGASLVIGGSVAGANNLGTGNVSLSGANPAAATVLQILTSATGQSVRLAAGGTLTLAAGSRADILRAAAAHTGGSFVLDGGTLDGDAATPAASGTLRLSGLDFQFNSGSILHAPDLWLDSGAGATAATVQTISGAGSSVITGLGDITKEGPGSLRIADSVASLSAANLFLRSGTLDLGTAADLALSGTLTLGVTSTGALPQTVLFRKAHQLAADIEVLAGYADILGNPYYNVATLSLGGYDQSIGSIKVGNLAFLRLDMGAPGSGASTLTLTGGNTGDVNILNYEGNPTSHLLDGSAATQDRLVLAPGSTVNPDDVWVYGFEKGVVADTAPGSVANEYKPAAFYTGTWHSINANYFDYRNWGTGTNVAGMEIPNHPGVTAVINAGASTSLNLGGSTVTWGQLIVNVANDTTGRSVSNGTIVWDSGVSGSAAVARNNGGSVYVYSAGSVLKSDLTLFGQHEFGGNISGSGALIVNHNLNLYGTNNTYEGGTVLNPGSQMSLSAARPGTGTLTINGGRILGGNLYVTNARSVVTLTNPLVLNGDFTASYLTFGYGGDVELTGTRTITVNEAPGNVVWNQSVTFSATTNLTGTGALVKNGAMGALHLLSANNTFSGGLTLAQSGYISTNAGAGGIVIGGSVAGRNYLGSGDINITAGEVMMSLSNNSTSEVRGTVNGPGNLRINGGGANTTVLLQDTGTLNGATLSLYLTGTVVNDGIAWANFPSMAFYNDVSTGTTWFTGSAVTGLRQLLKGNNGTAILDTMVSGSSLNMNGGRLILNQSGTFNVTYMTGGVLEAAASTHHDDLGVLQLSGNAGLFLGDHATMTFLRLSGTSAGAWLPTHQLNIANTSGTWNKTGATGVTDTYVYVTDTAVNGAQLDRIAFTGYTPGAEWLETAPGSNKWYLAPTGDTALEWSGNPGASFTGSAWSADADWLGGAPNTPGAYAAIRNMDNALSGKTILVDGAFTVGTLEISHANATFTLGGSGTLRFSDPTGTAALRLVNGNIPTFTAAWQLDSDLLLTSALATPNNMQAALNNKISGPGGITLVNSAPGGTKWLAIGGSAATSDFSGGFRWIGSTATSPNGPTAGTAPRLMLTADGTLFGTGTLAIGTGAAGMWYSLQPGAAGITRTVDLGGLELAGNLFFGQQTVNTNATLILRSTTGAGTLASGTWTLSGNGGNSSNATGGRSRLVLDLDIGGAGGLLIPGATRVDLLGDNTFSGGVTLSKGGSTYYEQYIGVGSDRAFGTGTLAFTGGGITYLDLLGGSRRLENDITFSGDRTIVRSGTLALAAGHSTRLTDTGDIAGARFTLEAGVVMTIEDGHDITGAGNWWFGDYDTTSGTMIFLGSNSYTGNTRLNAGMTLAVANDHAFGTGTFTFNNSTVAKVASHGGDVTLANPLAFAGANVNLDGRAGLLTLNPAQTMTLASDKTIVVHGGTAAFGPDFSLTGAGGLTKSGTGTLWLMSGSNAYTGDTRLAQGTLSADAVDGSISLGKNIAGENYFGTGMVSFVSGAYRRTLELITTGSVFLAGHLVLEGNSTAHTANVNVTEASGAVTGGSVVTHLNPDGGMVITGNDHGYLNIAGDLVQNTTGTVTFAGANIVAGGEFRLQAGAFDWTGGKLATANLDYTGGALTLGSVNSPDVARLTLGDNVTLDIAAGAEAVLSGALLHLSGTAATIDLHGTGVLTLGGATPAWSGSLLVANWDGELAGGGASRLQFSGAAPGAALLNSISFTDATPGVNYLSGARPTRNYLGLLELVPVGSGAEWSGSGGNNFWHVSQMLNWEPNSTPNAPGAVAAFHDLDPLLDGKTIELTQSVVLGGLLLGSTVADGYTISDGGGGYNLSLDSSSGAAYIQASTDNSVVIDALVSLNKNLEITNADTGTLTFNKAITANGRAVSKEGAGLVVFAAANQFTGGFTLNVGTVRMGHAAALGSNALTFNGGALDTGGTDRLLANNYTLGGTLALVGSATLAGGGNIRGGGLDLAAPGDTLTATGVLSGTGGLVKTGSGTLLLTAANTFQGGFTAAAGVTGITANAALGTGTTTLAGGTLRLDANGLNLANNVLAAGGVLDSLIGGGTLSGVISGGNGFTSAGGTLTLTASNAYTGTTNISSGVLVAADAGALGDSLASLASSSSLDLSFTGTYANATAGSGLAQTAVGAAVTLAGDNTAFTGTWQIAQNSAATITGTQNLGGGSVALTGTLATAGAANITLGNALTGGGVLRLGGSGAHALGAGAGSAFAGVVDAAGGAFIWDATASAALASSTLAATGGILDVTSGSQSALGLVLGGGTAAFTGTAFVTDFAIAAGGGGAVRFDPADLGAGPLLRQDEGGGGVLVVAQNVTGAAADARLVDSAGVTLGASSTRAVGSGTEALGVYSHTLALTGSTLGIDHSLHELILQAGKTLVLAGDDTAAPTGGDELHALVSGSGNLQIAATGAITLNTQETFTGTTTLSTGTLRAGVTDVIASSTALVNNGVFALGGFDQTVNNLGGAATGAILFGSNTNTLTAHQTADTAYAGAITGGGNFTKTGDAALTLSGSNTFTGTVTVDGGLLAITGWTGTTGAGYINGGTTSVSSGALWGATGNITVGNSGTGALNIAAGGTVSADSITFGNASLGGTDAVGTGSVAGLLAGNSIIVGGADDTSGALAVSGTVTGNYIEVGYLGTGTLAIGGSGVVTGSHMIVGGESSSRGEVVIGDSARVEINGDAYLAYQNDATGVLTVRGNGLFRANNDLVAGFAENDSGLNLSATIAVSGGTVATGRDLLLGNAHFNSPGDQWSGSGAAVVSGSGVVTVGRNLAVGVVATDGATGSESGAGRLALSGSGRAEVGGTYSQNGYSVLALDLAGSGTGHIFITAQSATLAGALEVDGFAAGGAVAKASDLAGDYRVVLRSSTTIRGNFDSVDLGVAAGAEDYIHAGGFIVNGGTDYAAGRVLSWYATPTNSHGTFTVTSGSFEVDVPLDDTTAHAGWDGDTLTKAGAGLLILSASNAHSGTTLVSAGTLAARNNFALGASAVVNDAALVLDTGLTAYDRNTGGSGTTIITAAAVAITGTNTQTGGWRVLGGGTVASQDNLGAGAVDIAAGGAGLFLAPPAAGGFDFINALSGSGALTVALATVSDTLTFNASTGTAFLGRVNLQRGAYGFSAADRTGAGALGHALLSLGAEGRATIDDHYTLGSLELAGGVVAVNLTGGNTLSGTLTVAGMLKAAAGGTLQANGLDLTGVAGTPVGGSQNFFEDSGSSSRHQLQAVVATGTVDTYTQIGLTDQNGAVITTGTVVERAIAGGSGTARYDYVATMGARADGAKGVFIGYGLKELAANSGTQILLLNASSTNVLDAKLTGAGGFRVEAGPAAARIGNAASDYTGTTTVATGTVHFETNNAFGQTALIAQLANTTVDLDNRSQNAGALDLAAGASLLAGAGTLTVSDTLGTGRAASAGLVSLTSGALTVDGNYTNTSATGTLAATLGGAPVVIGGTLANAGAAALAPRALEAGAYTGSTGARLDAASALIDGIFLNAGTATIGGAVTGGTLAVGGSLSNTGALTLGARATGTVGGPLANTGTLTLDLAAGLTALGAVDVSGGGKVDLATLGTLDTRAGGTLAGDGALAGTGTLNAGGSHARLVITGSNAVSLETTAGATDTLELRHIAALGSAGTVTTAATGTLLLNGVSGTLAHSLNGAGAVVLENNARVTLTGSSNASGTIAILDTGALTASEAKHTGSAEIAVTGTFIAANSGTWNLANALTGAGGLVKQNAGNLVISQSNARTGATLIDGGAITLKTSLGGLGAGGIEDNALLVLDASGTLANTLSGSGTVAVGASLATPVAVEVTGSNSAFAGLWDIFGDMGVTQPASLGSATTAITGTLRLHATGSSDWNYANTLTGGGALDAGLGGGEFAFTAATGSAFTGTVTLGHARYALADATPNEAALAHATLRPGAGSLVTLGTNAGAANDDMRIHGLAPNGGTLAVQMRSADTAHVLTIAVLDVTGPAAGATTIDLDGAALLTPPGAPLATNFLDQDGPGDSALKVVAADALAGAETQMNLALNGAAAALPVSSTLVVSDGVHGDIEATYEYKAVAAKDTAGGAGGAGIFVDYVLSQLKTNSGLIIDAAAPADAVDRTLSAALTGTGPVNFRAGAGAITLTGTNTYSGATTIETGTVIAGVNGALGATSLLSLAPLASFDLNATAQTIGALDGAAGSTLNLHTGTLAILNGGASAGALTGSGALALAGGTLTITNANTGLTASTSIALGATADLKDAAALGTGAIADHGTLRLDLAAGGTMANVLSGAGLFLKTGGATATLTAASAGFHGTGSIAQGRVSVTDESGLGDAAIGTAAGATFETLGVTGTLRNVLAGSGTFVLTDSNLVLGHANTIANTRLANSRALIRDALALGGSPGAVTLDAASVLTLEADAAQIGALALNGGRLAFARPETIGGGRPLFPVAGIRTLAGGAGVFEFNVDFSALYPGVVSAGDAANFLDIADAGNGAHTVVVNPHGIPRVANTSVELIHARTGGAVFQLAGGGVMEYDLTVFELLPGDGTPEIPDPQTWYLTDARLSHAADAILNTVAAAGLDWHHSLDSLRLRLGEIRGDRTLDHDSGNVWVRSRGYRLTASNALTGRDFRQYGYGVTAGADKTFHLENGATLLGGFVDMGAVSREFHNGGSGETRNAGVGAYLTRATAGGWFADLVGRADRYKNKLEARAVDGGVTRGNYSAGALGFSAEAGKRITRSRDGWWLEPSLQAAVFRMESATYDTLPSALVRPMRVRVGSVTGAQYRAQLRFGLDLARSRWRPYGRFAAVSVDSDGGAVTAHGRELQADFDGKRVEFGFGASYRVGDLAQLYWDYEYARAAAYERPWSVNLGYRRLW
ncbi:autotransporter-associated beta strand repeat-containing protein [Termitidicoccus mucosus]|uniref:autotransporter-associated beta strand repeat-containing protein n=2 Tax=Termitidicoccus mucosus TaxID=1184151 RepID=UPI003182D4F5